MSSLALPSVPGLSGRRCVVTGGAGFIGSSLVRVLCRSGAEVLALDNLATGRPSNLEPEEGEAPFSVELQRADVRDRERLARLLREGDLVFHLACLGVRHSIHSPFENLDVNARGTLTVLDAARWAGAARVVHVSSSEVYGTARSVPMTEEHPTDPHTVYGASKLDGECQARAFFRCYGFPTVVLRPFNAYGPRSHFEGDSGEVIPRFVVWALLGRPLTVFGDGTQTRDFTHVYDSAAAIARAGVADGAVGETFNVGAGREISVRALAETVLGAIGRDDVPIEQADPRPGDVLRLLADARRAREILGHESSIPLVEGLADLGRRLASLGDEALEAMAARIVARNWE